MHQLKQQGSLQGIGLFRCSDNEAEANVERFWDSGLEFPFLAVCFLQLADKQNYERLQKNIEKDYFCGEKKHDKSYSILYI